MEMSRGDGSRQSGHVGEERGQAALQDADDSDDDSDWSADYDKCIDEGEVRREMARDYVEEAMRHKCFTALEREVMYVCLYMFPNALARTRTYSYTP